VCDIAEACTGTAPSCPANRFQPNATPCDDGLFCNGTDTCSSGDCVHSGNPCGSGTDCARTCNEAAANCVAGPGTPCTSDGNVCTNDQCDGLGTCMHQANTISCDDGDVCTLGDTCVDGVCRGDPARCGDGIVQVLCGEQCDDGNTVGSDACPADCRLGLPDAIPAKTAGGCQKAIDKAALKFVNTTLNRIDKCTNLILKCVQMLRDTDPKQVACIEKARSACTGDLADVAVAKDNFKERIVQACSEALVSNVDMRGDHGLGYDRLEAECTSLDTAADIATCLVDQHVCQSTRLFDVQAPRLSELLTLADIDRSQLSCISDFGGGGSVDDPKGIGKAIVQCSSTIGKVVASLVSKKLKSLAKCVDKVFTCVQTRPFDGSCVPKARQTCLKQLATLTTVTARLDRQVDKKCLAIDFASLLGSPSGAFLQAPTAECALLGVPTIGTYGDYKRCLFHQYECRAEELFQFEAPRAEELLGLVGLQLRSVFCP